MAKDKDEKKQLEIGDDEVVVKKGDLKALMDRVTKLEGGTNENLLDEPEVRTVRIRMWDGKPVSHMDNVLRTGKTNPSTGDEIMSCDIHFADGDKETVDYLKFLASCPVEVCEVVEDVAKPVKKIVHEDGLIDVTRIDGHRSVSTGVKVPSVVRSVEHTYRVKLGTGDVVVIKTPNL